MAKYEYHRIEHLEDGLREAGVARRTIDRIMEGGDAIRRGTKPEEKAAWMAEAMRRMDKLLDKRTRYAAREACACCLGGRRLKTAKAIAKANGTLEERIKAVDDARFVGSAVIQKDGKILVRFGAGPPPYRCVCLPKAEKPLSITYCYCCGGHVKHHLQIALGRSLNCKVRSSALSSGGKKPCTFLFALAD